MMPIKGEPVVFDKLKPDLGSKLVKAVADDMARAKRAAEERARKKKSAKKR
jgi:hypothetical protein